MAREQLERDYGASAEDTEKVKCVLERHGLEVVAESRVSGSLIARGSAERMESVFHPRLGLYETAGGGVFRGREADVKLPRQLDGLVTGVFGLDQRRVAGRRTTADASPPTAPDPARALGPDRLEKRYRLPAGNGEGQTIAIAEFGGGYFPHDLDTYCETHRRARPQVKVSPVGIAPRTPEQIAALPPAQQGAAQGESQELMMDVEVVAGLCPKADIRLLTAPFDQKGWIDLLDAVLGLDPAPVALSISWGLAEDAPDWSPAARSAIDDRLHMAALLGITACAATGDDGSGDQMHDGRAHVHFPASSPFTLAVGGTMLDGDDEVVWWNAPGDRSQHGGGSTGGGVSAVFPRPRWQRVRRVRSLNPGSLDGRIVPDVAALAGLPGYSLVFNGRLTVNGGTSAAAPLWASVIARVAARSPAQNAGFLTPLLYRRGPDGRVRGRTAFTDITKGNNRSPQPGRGYRARPDYDAVTGWGVPDGEALLSSLAPRRAAGR